MNYVNTMITSPDANAFFGNNGCPLDSLTLETVLRFVALKHHQGDIETIKAIKCMGSQFSTYNEARYYTEYAKSHGIELFILTAPRGAQLPIISEEDGWVALDAAPYPVAQFLSSASETRVYTNTAIKSTIVFVRQATDKWIDGLCSVMFRVLPWYFEDQLNDDEAALFKAIGKRDGDAFVQIINDLCERYDFKSARHKRTLIGWNDGYRKSQIQVLKNNAESALNSIRDYEQELAKMLNRLDTYNQNLLALQAQEDSADDSVYKFFMNHRNINIYSTKLGTSDGNVMDYCVLETIEFFDRDEFLRVYNNKSSNIGCASKEVRDILYAIFGLEEGKGLFRVESMFRLINLSSLSVLRSTRSHQYDYTHLPHPHLVNYGCLGGNGRYITEYMQQGNWDMAIEQSIAATKNINFGDSTVIGSFVNTIRNSMDNCRCIIADNGKEMTPREFLAYINENNEHEGATNG